jgi:uncharacterized protein
MKELLEFLIKEITGSDDCEISIEEEENRVVFNIKAPADHIGIIIGKEGRTIKSIQEIMRVRAKLEGKMVYVSVAEK